MGDITLGCLLLCILSFFLPPLAVFFKVTCGLHFWINIILTILCWVPGVIHALIVVITM
ncbi:hypothetical protein EHI8A_001000 [Entamoeba histolytica HM-1:IMSS-B]|uniref:Proteolipid membrane potential modulator n=6 Tax=Entamoeba TaxID=5758 RepID=M3US66_ENTH1|nr:hypothetical protein ENU1_013940 [Entamoeba nuttalli P19]EMD46241.1 Hypothetical protein EHI5A_011090 [Entamoeba histolytica KU27]EMH73952.1 hypothetical protein EHI8A_001000 [Entamoeba histolytica HM-1:IMSS-B]EMS11660.1 hypothetical protein KM1_011140 [Entamoeba histolytica HM-3:IMSS]ENY65385.1 hypothetical protein EHI7A_002670 [Entamoeba histolytica HM-1:IMSS-A]EKE42672.1 hypothetical protein ENU1_013940 [Entamoeba nuttalli P19]|eukprot:XP_008854983.1 hypothetical protein ENU1_013940 [Entamoeba nuttalli P19]